MFVSFSWKLVWLSGTCCRRQHTNLYSVPVVPSSFGRVILISIFALIQGGPGGAIILEIFTEWYVTCETERLKHVALSVFIQIHESRESLQRRYIVVIEVNLFGFFKYKLHVSVGDCGSIHQGHKLFSQ